MKLLKAIGVATAATLTLCADAAAQALKLELTPVAGAQFFTSRPPSRFMMSEQHFHHAELPTALAVGGHVGLRLGDVFGIEGNAFVVPNTMTATVGTELKDIDVMLLTIGGSASMLLPQVIDPLQTFIVAGAGLKRYDYDDPTLDPVNAVMWNVGTGATWALRPRLALYVEARDYMSLFDSGLNAIGDAWQHDLMFGAGVRYTISRRPVTVAGR